MSTPSRSNHWRDVGADVGLVLVVGEGDLDLELRVRVRLHVILRRHLRGHDRSLTGGVGIEARLIVEHADLDAAVEGGLAEGGRRDGE
jgi:hypothetical protein